MTNLSIDAITKYIDINNAKRMEGVRVNGTAPSGSVIAVIWGTARKFVTVNATGSWSALFAANEWPTDPGRGTISANTISGNPGATTLRTSKALPFDMTGAIASRLDTQVADGKINADVKTAVPSVKGVPPSDAGMHGTSEASNPPGSTDGHGTAQVTTASADAHASGLAPMVVARPADAAGRAATPAAGAVATYTAVSTSAVPAAESRAITLDTLRLLTARDDVAGQQWTASATQAVRISSATRGDKTHVAVVETDLTRDLTVEGWFKGDLPTDSATQQLFHMSSMELFLRNGKLFTWSREGGGDMVVSGFTPDKAWHHYALSTDGEGNWQVYVDGVKMQSRSGAKTPSEYTRWQIMLGNHNNASNSFVGLMANVQVWESQRTAADIAQDMLSVSNGSNDLRGSWLGGDWGDWDSVVKHVGATGMVLGSGCTSAEIDRTYISNDTTQSLTGTFYGRMNSGDTLGVYDGDKVLGTFPLSGEWWYYTTPTLAEGMHTLTAQVRDASGKTRWVSKKYSVNIDVSSAKCTINTVATDNRVNAAEKAAGVTISGTAEANGSVEVTWGTRTKTVKINASGIWYSDFVSTEIPADAAKSTITVKATDVAGNVSIATSTVEVDASIPTMPLINAVSADNTINAAEKAAGVTVSGVSEPYTTVDLVWGSSTKLINVNSTGLWTTFFASASIPPDGKKTPIMASARDNAGNVTSTTFRSVTIDTAAPAAPKINAVSSDNRVNAAEKAAGVTVSGTAEANNQVEVKWGSSTRIVSANESGIWTTVFSAAEIPADSERTVITAKATNLVGNISALHTSTVVVDTTMPFDPVIFRVSGDDRISLSEKNAGVTLNGTAEANGNVEVIWGTTSKSSKINPAGFWSLKFESSEIPVDPVASTITVKSSDAAGNISTASRNVIYGTSPIINLVSGDDRINAAEKKSGVVVSGGAESNSNLEVSWGTSTKTIKANATGEWTSTFASADIPQDAISSMITVKVLGTTGAAAVSSSRTVKIDTAAPVELAGKIDGLMFTNGTPFVRLIMDKLSAGDRWEYSTDSGNTWKSPSSDGWTAVALSTLRDEGVLQTRLIDAAGNYGTGAKVITNGRVLLGDSFASALEKKSNIEFDLSSHSQLVPYGQSWIGDDGKGLVMSLKTFKDLLPLTEREGVYGQLEALLQSSTSGFLNLGSNRADSIAFLSKLSSLGLTVYKDKVIDNLGVSNAMLWEIYDASRATIKFWMQELSVDIKNRKTYFGNFNKNTTNITTENFDSAASNLGGNYERDPEGTTKDGLKPGHFTIVDNFTIDTVQVNPVSGAGKFLVAKGSSYAGVPIHEFGATIYAGKTYLLSFRGLGRSDNPASIKVDVDGATVASGLVLNTLEWTTQTIAWTATKTITNASIKIINTNRSPIGNLFAIDDVQLGSSGVTKIAETDQYQTASLFLGEIISKAVTDNNTKSKLVAIRKIYNGVFDLVKVNDLDSALVPLAGSYWQSVDVINSLVACTPEGVVKKDSITWGLGVTRYDNGLYVATKETLKYWLAQIVYFQNAFLSGLQADGRLPQELDVGAADVKDLNTYLQFLPSSMIYTDAGKQKTNPSTFFNPDSNKLLNAGLLYAQAPSAIGVANNSTKYYLDNSKLSGSRVEIEFYREGFNRAASSYSDEYRDTFPGAGTFKVTNSFVNWGFNLSGSADSDGKFLMVDGSTDSEKHFLKITTPKRLEKDVEYILRFQAATGKDERKAILQLTVNGEDVGAPVEIVGTSWKEYVIRFSPTKAGDKVGFRDLTTEADGNDFAIDDLRISYTTINSDLLNNIDRVGKLPESFVPDKQNTLGQILLVREGFNSSASKFADGYSSAFPGPGTYAVRREFKDWGFDLGRSSDDDGSFLIADGAADSSKKVIQVNAKVNLVERAEYIVKLFAASGSSDKLAKLQLTLNGKDIGKPVELSGKEWREYAIGFTAPQSGKDQKIGLRDLNTEASGNDFALDDFRLNLSLASFKKVQSEKYFITRFFVDETFGTGYAKGDGLQLGEYSVFSGYDGNGLKLTVDADGDNRFGLYRATDSGEALWQEKDVVFRPGESYELSVYSASNLAGEALPKLSLEIDGTSVGSTVVGTGDWSRSVIKFNAPEKAGVSTIKLIQSNASAKGGYVALDGIRVEETRSPSGASEVDIAEMKKFLSKMSDFVSNTKSIEDYFKNIGDLFANTSLPSLILPVRPSELTELVIQDRWALMVRNYWFAYGFQAASEKRIKDWTYDVEHNIKVDGKPLTGPESAKMLLSIVGNFVAYDWYQATMYAFGQRLNNFKLTGNTNEDVKAGFQLAVNSIFTFGRLFIWGGGMYGAISANESDQWGKSGVKSFNGGLGFTIAAIGRLVSIGTTVVDIVNTSKMPAGSAKDAAIVKVTAELTAAISGVVTNSSLALTQFAIGAKDLSKANFPGTSRPVFSSDFADTLTRNKATYQKIAAAVGGVQVLASISASVAGLASSTGSDGEKLAIASELALNIFGGIATSKATSAISKEIAFLGVASKGSIAKLALGNLIGALNPIGIYSIVKAYEQAGKMQELANLIGRQDTYSGDQILADLLRSSADLEVGVYTVQFIAGVGGVIIEYSAAVGGLSGGAAFGIQLLLGTVSGIAEGVKQPLLESFADKAKERMLKESGGDLLKYFTNAHISKVADYVKNKEVVDFFAATYSDLKVDRVIGVLTTHDDPLMRELAGITKTTEFLPLSHTTTLGFTGQNLAEDKLVVDTEKRTIDISSSAASQHLMLLTPLTPVLNYQKERIDAGKNSFASKIKVLGVEGWTITDGASNSTVDLSTLVGFHLTSAADSIGTLNLSSPDVWSVATQLNLGGGNDYLKVNISKAVVDGGEGWDTVDYGAVSDRSKLSNLEFRFEESGDITVRKDLLNQRIYASNISSENIQYGKRTEKVDYREVKSIFVERFSEKITDTLKNVEMVVGSLGPDKFYGNSKANVFEYGVNDFYDGGADVDVVDFSVISQRSMVTEKNVASSNASEKAILAKIVADYTGFDHFDKWAREVIYSHMGFETIGEIPDVVKLPIYRAIADEYIKAFGRAYNSYTDSKNLIVVPPAWEDAYGDLPPTASAMGSVSGLDFGSTKLADFLSAQGAEGKKIFYNRSFNPDSVFDFENLLSSYKTAWNDSGVGDFVSGKIGKDDGSLASIFKYVRFDALPYAYIPGTNMLHLKDENFKNIEAFNLSENSEWVQGDVSGSTYILNGGDDIFQSTSVLGVTVDGGSGSNKIYGGVGKDAIISLTVKSSNDIEYVDAGGGDDVLKIGKSGSYFGGLGNDQFYLADSLDAGSNKPNTLANIKTSANGGNGTDAFLFAGDSSYDSSSQTYVWTESGERGSWSLKDLDATFLNVSLVGFEELQGHVGNDYFFAMTAKNGVIGTDVSSAVQTYYGSTGVDVYGLNPRSINLLDFGLFKNADVNLVAGANAFYDFKHGNYLASNKSTSVVDFVSQVYLTPNSDRLDVTGGQFDLLAGGGNDSIYFKDYSGFADLGVGDDVARFGLNGLSLVGGTGSDLFQVDDKLSSPDFSAVFGGATVVMRAEDADLLKVNAPVGRGAELVVYVGSDGGVESMIDFGEAASSDIRWSRDEGDLRGLFNSSKNNAEQNLLEIVIKDAKYFSEGKKDVKVSFDSASGPSASSTIAKLYSTAPELGSEIFKTVQGVNNSLKSYHSDGAISLKGLGVGGEYIDSLMYLAAYSGKSVV